MRRLLCLSGLLLPAIFALGCDQETIDETGDFELPTGLAVVHRPSASGPDTREDLLIVDGASEGVRVQQFYRPEDPADFRFDFVRSPSVFFPMVIPAAGSPSEVAVNTAGLKAYVIAPFAAARDPETNRKQAELPASAYLYVLDVAMTTDIPGRASDPGNTTLGAIALQDHPVDLVVLSTTMTTDRVAVVSDGFDGSGRLELFDITATDAAPTSVLVADVPVGASPRSMISVSNPDALLIGFAGGADANQVAQVGLQIDPPSLHLIDVGGPVSRVIALDDRRALAFRADLPAAIVLERQADGLFARSSQQFTTPYTDAALLGPGQAAGRIDTPDFIVSGAIAKPSSGFQDMPLQEVLDDGVVMLSLLNGTVVFLHGGTLNMRVDAPAVVSQIRPTTAAALVHLRECEADVIQWCVDLTDTEDLTPTICAGLVRPSGLDQDAQFRAVYRGALVSERGVTMAVNTTTGTTADATISLGYALNERLVRAGDSVDLQAASCGTFAEPWRLSGTVVAVSSELEVRFSLGTGPSAEDLKTCDLSTALFEVRPSADEFVFQRLQNHSVAEVEARVPVLAGIDGPVARIESRPDGTPTSLAFTIVVDTATTSAKWSGINDRRCEFASECGEGRSCTRAALMATASCPSLCAESCDGSAGCNPAEQTWTAPGLEFDVAASDVKLVDLGDTSLRQVLNPNDFEVVNAIPHDTVWMPVWQVWATSFPGSRTVIQLRPGTSGFSLRLSR